MTSRSEILDIAEQKVRLAIEAGGGTLEVNRRKPPKLKPGDRLIVMRDGGHGPSEEDPSIVLMTAGFDGYIGVRTDAEIRPAREALLGLLHATLLDHEWWDTHPDLVRVDPGEVEYGAADELDDGLAGFSAEFTFVYQPPEGSI